ncbi:NRDE family protein [Nannocystaceae bacterium ST9]
MCTIVVALAVWPDSPLVIAANRDELLARPAESPRLRAAGELAVRAVLAPRDELAGGTWLGLSERELFVGITNRRSGPAKRELRSRGELVTGALGIGDRAGARAWVEGLEPSHYNPFHLLLADRFGAEVLWSEGRRLTRVDLEPGIHWLTERSFDAGPSQRHALLAEHGRALLTGPEPNLARWRAILADHRPHAEPGQRPPDDRVGFDSMCVHAMPVGYGTRSSTLVRLGRSVGDVEFHHAPGRPCETAFVDHSDAARRLLARLRGTSDAGETEIE